MPASKPPKKPSVRAARAVKSKHKKSTTVTKGTRKRRAATTQALDTLNTPAAPAVSAEVPAADLREALHTEENAAAPSSNLTSASAAEADVKRIRESAQRLGIELDEQEALQWLAQMAVQDTSEVTVDTKNFIYGAKIAILDFSTKDLEYYRRIGKIVELPDQPGVVETALALSGSAAQSKIQTNPGDADFFERVNIKAPTQADAVKILANTMRAKALSTLRGADYQLLSVKFGTFAEAATLNGKLIKKDSPMAWDPHAVQAGKFDVTLEDGTTKTILWEDGMVNPGWTKFDWVVADPKLGILANASNLLDVTWEAPDGTIIPLDGFIDPYFQEVYLDAGSVPIFSKLVKHVDEDALGKYVTDLEYEVYKYLVKHPNYGKVAKRSYNVFRLTGHFAEAAYVRELFDEPTTALYRVWSMFETLTSASTPDSQVDRVALLKQYDQLIQQVVISTEGEKEIRVVRALMRARDEALGIQPVVESLDVQFAASRDDVMELLNNYFHDLLYGFPPVAAFLEEIRSRRLLYD